MKLYSELTFVNAYNSFDTFMHFVDLANEHVLLFLIHTAYFIFIFKILLCVYVYIDQLILYDMYNVHIIVYYYLNQCTVASTSGYTIRGLLVTTICNYLAFSASSCVIVCLICDICIFFALYIICMQMLCIYAYH